MAVESYAGSGTASSGFLLEVDGVQIGIFNQVTGLQVEIDVEHYEEGGENGFVHAFPGQMRWPHLVFRAGLTSSDDLFAWMRRSAGEGFDAAGGKLERSTAAVTMLDPRGRRLRSWSVEGAFPVSWSGPELSVDSSGEAQEVLTVAHHGFRSQEVNT